MQSVKEKMAKPNFFIIETIFKVIYILHLLLSVSVYVTGRKVMLLSAGCVLLIGAFIIFARLFKVKFYIKVKKVLFLVLFLISFCVSSFFVYKYAIFDSIKTLVWMAFWFFILFTFNTEATEKQVKSDFISVSATILSFVTIQNLVSLIMLFTGFYQKYVNPEGVMFHVGIAHWGRLFGIHTDPNYACVYSLTAVLIAVYLFIKYKNKALRALLCVFSIINFFYVVFTASRTGQVCSYVGIIAFTVCYLRIKYKNKNWLKTVAIAVMVAVVVFASNLCIKEGWNLSSQLIAGDNSQIGRTEEEFGEDISNRRFDIWKSATEISKENAVIGIGFENVLGYANDKMPNTYIVNNDHSDFDAFHNVVFDILVSQGIVGVLLAVGFAVTVLATTFKNYTHTHETVKTEAALCLSICLMVLASALFLSHIFYVNCPTSFIFWAYLGYFIKFLTLKEEKNGTLN